jgi:hypothetical protein
MTHPGLAKEANMHVAEEVFGGPHERAMHVLTIRRCKRHGTEQGYHTVSCKCEASVGR